MTPKQLMREDSSDFCKFEDVANPKSKRPDLHAFLLLDEICSDQERDVLAAAEHDEVWLSFDPDEAFEKMTLDQAKDLRRCGVMYSESYNGFSMFV